MKVRIKITVCDDNGTPIVCQNPQNKNTYEFELECKGMQCQTKTLEEGNPFSLAYYLADDLQQVFQSGRYNDIFGNPTKIALRG